MKGSKFKLSPAIIDRIQRRDTGVLDQLYGNYDKIIVAAARETLKKGGVLHRQLSIHYEELYPDIISITYSFIARLIISGKAGTFIANPEGTVSRIARNRTTDIVRKSISRRRMGVTKDHNLLFPSFHDVDADPHEPPFIGGFSPERREEAKDALIKLEGRLTSQQWDIARRAAEGESQREIAEAIGLSKGSVQNRLAECREVLKSLISSDSR